MPKKIMRDFRIDEISGCDFPAQKGATVAIMKRGKPDDLKKTHAIVLTTETDGHQHGISVSNYKCGCGCDQFDIYLDYSSDRDGDNHGHPLMLDPLTIGASIGHKHDIEGTAILSLAKNGGAHMTMEKDDDQTTTTDDTTTATKPSRAEVDAENTRLNAIVGLTSEERAHFDALPDNMRTAFLGKSAGDRQAEIVAKNSADPVVYTTQDGVEIRKSMGAAMLSLAKSNDILRKGNDEMVKAREQDAFEKRADTELSHIAGDVQMRAAMLKAVEAIPDEAQRTGALAALRSKNEVGKAAFQTVGHIGSSFESGSAEEALDTMAKVLVEKDGSTYQVAYAKAMTTPEGNALYKKSLEAATS